LHIPCQHEIRCDKSKAEQFIYAQPPLTLQYTQFCRRMHFCSSNEPQNIAQLLI